MLRQFQVNAKIRTLNKGAVLGTLPELHLPESTSKIETQEARDNRSRLSPEDSLQ